MLVKALERKILNRVVYVCSHCGRETTSFLYGTGWIGLRGQAHLECKKCGYNRDTIYVTRNIF